MERHLTVVRIRRSRGAVADAAACPQEPGGVGLWSSAVLTELGHDDAGVRSVARALASLIPPERLPLAHGSRRTCVLPQGTTAVPGPMRLWPYQRAIADSIGHPEVERVTLVQGRSHRLHRAADGGARALRRQRPGADPVPAADREPTAATTWCRDIEPMFRRLAGAARGALPRGRSRRGSLDHLASPVRRRLAQDRRQQGPRNLRRHTARVLFVDEADAMETSAEGAPIVLAEKRTLSFCRPQDRRRLDAADRGDVSAVLRAYGAQRSAGVRGPVPALRRLH